MLKILRNKIEKFEFYNYCKNIDPVISIIISSKKLCIIGTLIGSVIGGGISYLKFYDNNYIDLTIFIEPIERIDILDKKSHAFVLDKMKLTDCEFIMNFNYPFCNSIYFSDFSNSGIIKANLSIDKKNLSKFMFLENINQVIINKIRKNNDLFPIFKYADIKNNEDKFDTKFKNIFNNYYLNEINEEYKIIKFIISGASFSFLAILILLLISNNIKNRLE